jgi:hypothetical protein
MIDIWFSVKGTTLTYKGRQYQMVEAGVKDDKPYARVKPPNKTVEGIVVAQIRKCIPFPFSPDEVQRALNKPK